jgi:hypothetical protein
VTSPQRPLDGAALSSINRGDGAPLLKQPRNATSASI